MWSKKAILSENSAKQQKSGELTASSLVPRDSVIALSDSFWAAFQQRSRRGRIAQLKWFVRAQDDSRIMMLSFISSRRHADDDDAQ